MELRALGPLLDWARAVVPASQWKLTPIYLFSTAGVRKMPEQERTALMEGVRKLLTASGLRCEWMSRKAVVALMGGGGDAF